MTKAKTVMRGISLVERAKALARSDQKAAVALLREHGMTDKDIAFLLEVSADAATPICKGKQP